MATILIMLLGNSERNPEKIKRMIKRSQMEIVRLTETFCDENMMIRKRK